MRYRVLAAFTAFQREYRPGDVSELQEWLPEDDRAGEIAKRLKTGHLEEIEPPEHE